MRKKIVISVLLLILMKTVYADALYSILNSSRHIEKIEGNIAGIESSLLRSNQDIDYLMKQVNGSMVGHSGWGTYQFHDYQSYGQGATSWAALAQTIHIGGGAGQL